MAFDSGYSPPLALITSWSLVGNPRLDKKSIPDLQFPISGRALVDMKRLKHQAAWPESYPNPLIRPDHICLLRFWSGIYDWPWSVDSNHLLVRLPDQCLTRNTCLGPDPYFRPWLELPDQGLTRSTNLGPHSYLVIRLYLIICSQALIRNT